MTTLPKEIKDHIESEARNYAWRNYESKADNPQSEYENINTWGDAACYSYYSLLYYLNGDNPACFEPGLFSVQKLHTLQQDNERLTMKLMDAYTELGRYVTEEHANAALIAQPEADNQQNENV